MGGIGEEFYPRIINKNTYGFGPVGGTGVQEAGNGNSNSKIIG